MTEIDLSLLKSHYFELANTAPNTIYEVSLHNAVQIQIL